MSKHGDYSTRKRSSYFGAPPYLLLEDGLAPVLNNVFQKLKFRTAVRPTYKCIFTIMVRPMIVKNARAPVANIVGLELLGSCDFLQVAQRHHERAFRVIQVTPQGGLVTYGDGASWVERLGDEEYFVQPLRRKLRELQRRMVAEHDQAIVDRVLQVGLAGVANMAAVSERQHLQALAAMMGRRLVP
jgi:hypothetical protein